MKFVFCSVFVSLYLLAVISAKEHIPVLLWSPSVNVPKEFGLRHIGSAHFSQLLHGATDEKKPMVVVFLEDELSVEDFSLRAADEEAIFPKLTKEALVGNVEFLPSVSNPMKAIRLLKENGYAWERHHGKLPKDLSTPTVLVVNLEQSPSQERQDSLRAHDSEIAHIYGKLKAMYPNILAIYTAKKSSWRESDAQSNRVRREAGDEGNTEEPYDGFVMSKDGLAILAHNITYKTAADTVLNFAGLTAVGVHNDSTDATETDVAVSFLVLTANYTTGGAIEFWVAASPEGWGWELEKVKYDGKDNIPLTPVAAPRGWSWFCNKETTFTVGKKSTIYPRLVIEGLQLQPYINPDTFEFGQPIDCVPYFSVAIWSGILMAILLLSIMSCGVTMLMDIRTNDRFDDPKGKTITISATD